jgi:hypothetical protein
MFKYLVAVHVNFKTGCIQELFGLPFLVRPAAAGIFYKKLFGIATIGM